MNTSLYAAFLLAAGLLILSPGPTVMLVTSTSLRRGRRAGLIAVAGSTLAAALQLLVVVAGLASIAALAGNWFELIRFAGVVYLIYLGLEAWLSKSDEVVADRRGRASGFRDFSQGFIVTSTNPKTLLFHGAFLPQFIDPALPEFPQMMLLAVTFVVIAGVGDSGWAILAARAGSALRSRRARRVVNRVSGSILIGAAAALAAVRRSE